MKKTKQSVLSKNDKDTSVRVFIFVALACEAKPLINAFDLKKDTDIRQFSIYKADEVLLTVTGVGKIAMAAAVAYSLALFNHQAYPVLLNVGIAGHKSQELGSIYRAMKIIDLDSATIFYPPSIARNGLESAVLMTVSIPVKDYQADLLYDMEGSAFYQIAARFSTGELIQCIKIVSDNQLSAIEKINTKQIVKWVSKHVNVIDSTVKALLVLSSLLITKEPEGYRQIIDEWHFTVSGQLKLKALLLRWMIMTDGVPFSISIKTCKNAKEVLRKLETELDRLAFFL